MIAVTDIQGQRHWIPRSQITDIDHPGNVHALVGGLLGVYGFANIAVGLPTCTSGRYEGAQQGAVCAGTFAPLGIGLGMLIWGLATHSASDEAVQNRALIEPEPEWEDAHVARKPAPTRVPDDDDEDDDEEGDDGAEPPAKEDDKGPSE